MALCSSARDRPYIKLASARNIWTAGSRIRLLYLLALLLTLPSSLPLHQRLLPRAPCSRSPKYVQSLRLASPASSFAPAGRMYSIIQSPEGSESRPFSFRKDGSLFQAVANDVEEKTLVVVKEPEEDEKLREVSVAVKIDEAVRTFAQEYLLPTMYKEGGIGIAAIQVGLPVRMFILDIPVVVSIDGAAVQRSDPRYVRKAVAGGKTLRVKETRPVYSAGEVSLRQSERVVGPAPDSDEIDETVCIERRPVFVLHPVITNFSEEQIVIEEGCLSVPMSFVESTFGPGSVRVRRPVGLQMSFVDLQGVPGHLAVDGSLDEHQKWMARCIQHEYDHLDGILYTDKMYRYHEDAAIS
ncbi:peptide deformylase [Ochromonadaceae sp. CCMP2298]|nr:peptide deformylase [Ochromonadaceae sp. CCMP2298]|mmetsp:Transcript_31707/g.68245  ORF Transcript_31707/g.68245 Transcript_31707/m.68245 type:complete len:354 (+) Transcript_31707:20-1081(+)